MKSCDAKWVKKIRFGLECAYLNAPYVVFCIQMSFYTYIFRLNLAKCVAGFSTHINSTARHVRNRVLRRRHIPHTIGPDVFLLRFHCSAISYFLSHSYVRRSRICPSPLLCVICAFFWFSVIVSGRKFLISVSVASATDHTRRHRICVRRTQEKRRTKAKFFHKYSWHIEATQNDKQQRNRRRMARTLNAAYGVVSILEHLNMCGDRKWNANDSTMHFAAICSLCKYADNVLFGYFVEQ